MGASSAPAKPGVFGMLHFFGYEVHLDLIGLKGAPFWMPLLYGFK